MEILVIIAAVLSFAVLNVDVTGHFPPPLTKDEEKRLFSEYKKGDEDARLKLIEHNLRLVAHIVRKYYSPQNEDVRDDLISIGTIGLIKAVDSYDPGNGTKFATYGARCIQNEILMYFRSRKKCQNEVSIYDTIDTDKDGNPLTYMDIIRCEDTIADDLYMKIRKDEAVRYIKNSLTDRERKIMIMRYGIDGGKTLTQRETAEKLGISRSYVSRIEKNVLERLGAYLERR